MNDSYWNVKLEFLKAIRSGWCNDDYIEFLVDKVWKIDKPVKIIDFGCGFGYMGILLLPILPEGSTYTGIDISDTLLNDARNIFTELKYDANFVKCDLNEFLPEERYDIAISQAVLRHIPNAKNILNKMIHSVIKGGMVICMEGDLEIEKTVQYFSDFDYIGTGMIPLYRKIYRSELNQGGRDYRVGIKIPIYMQELGLKNVDVRLNDRVKFINPYGDSAKHNKEYDEITTAWDWNKRLSYEDKEKMMKTLVDRGLTKGEAKIFTDSHASICDHVLDNKDTVYILKPSCTLIS
ncbi:class I SAM-dependent methyltransferase [Abyssisolibacter fermentans]|uniref:class I SAM-dependent methyltransferase n=1 Tax=Abyssisolibacter fermentans TaxID=1766203 RepID=UPI0008377E42|nr:methyltransferase domain-containing protein [Abyssisolibacter fermentans]